MLTFQQLRKLKPAPCSKPVVEVSNPKPFTTNGQEKLLHHVALCYGHTVVKATVCNTEKLKLMAKGKSVIVNKYILKTDLTMTITTTSKIYKCAKLQNTLSTLRQSLLKNCIL